MADLNPQPLPPRSRVTVHVPSRALNDLGAMQKITAQVLEKLGCPGCHSGRALDFVELEQFIVDPESLNVTELRGFGG